MLKIDQHVLLDGKPGKIVGFGDDGEIDVDMDDGGKRWLYWAPHRIQVIATACICPPVPDRQFDWVASYDNDDGQPCWFGPTETDAVADLIENYPREVA